MKDKFSIFAGWFIDGSGEPVRENVRVEVEAGIVRTVFQVEGEKPDAFCDKDYSNCTIIPGLIDSHVHLFMSGTGDQTIRRHQLSAGYTDIRETIAIHLNEHQAHGVVAVRDGGDGQGHAYRFKSELPVGGGMPVRLKVAGKAWRRRKRYGRLIGRPPGVGQTLAQAVAGDGDIIDHVKIVNSGLNSLKEFGKQTMPQFDLAEMTAAVEAARQKGLGVMVHANGPLPVEISIKAGCRSIEHGFFMGRDNLERMAETRTIWVPTACTMKAYAETLPQDSPEADIARRNLDHQLEQISMARKLGVKVAVGTDAGSLGVHHGRAIKQEIGLLMAAGFSVSEAVRAATQTGADLLALEDIGMLKPDKEATFVVVKGAPDQLPGSLHHIAGVYIKGRPLNVGFHMRSTQPTDSAHKFVG